MRRKITKIILWIVGLLVVLAIGLTLFIGQQVFEGYTNAVSREDTLTYAETYREKFDNFVKDKNFQKVEFPSSKYDHQIPAILIKEPQNKDIAVLVHGMGGTSRSLTDVMGVFLDLGYNVLAIDQRNSGDNLAPYNTFGVLESYDILDAINYAKNEMSEEGKLVLWGESYGGASAAIAAGRNEESIDYLILESPVADSNELLDQELYDIEAQQKIPANYMRFAGNLYTMLKLHFSFKDIDASDYLKNITIPVLITNADQDTLTPPHMGEALFEAIPHDKKQLYTAKGFKHAVFPREDTATYRQIVSQFLQQYP